MFGVCHFVCYKLRVQTNCFHSWQAGSARHYICDSLVLSSTVFIGTQVSYGLVECGAETDNIMVIGNTVRLEFHKTLNIYCTLFCVDERIKENMRLESSSSSWHLSVGMTTAEIDEVESSM